MRAVSFGRAQRRGGGDGGRRMPCRRLSRRRNSAATRGSCSIRPRRSMSWMRLSGGRPATRAQKVVSTMRHGLERDGRVGERVSDGRLTDESRRPPAPPPGIDRAVTLGDLEGRLRVATSGRNPVWPSVPRVADRGAAEELIDETPLALVRHRLTDDRAGRRGAPGRRPRPRTSAMARTFSASMSAAARTRIRSSSSWVAAMSARDSPRRPSGHAPRCRSPRDEPRPGWRRARPRRWPDRDGPHRHP